MLILYLRRDSNPHDQGRQILSLLCLPFHHSGNNILYYKNTKKLCTNKITNPKYAINLFLYKIDKKTKKI